MFELALRFVGMGMGMALLFFCGACGEADEKGVNKHSLYCVSKKFDITSLIRGPSFCEHLVFVKHIAQSTAIAILNKPSTPHLVNQLRLSKHHVKPPSQLSTNAYFFARKSHNGHKGTVGKL